MGTTALDTLPDELILDVIGHLNTARDLSTLSATSRRTHDLVQRDGWKAFARRGFPSLRAPSNGATSWSAVADRLTYLDRCWEKRGFLVRNFSEQPQRGPRLGGPRGRQSVSFYPTLGARLLSSLDHELVAWGAGQDLVARLGPARGKGQEQWFRLEGHKAGYMGGFGDVTAVSVVDRDPSSPEIIVGRANDELKLVRATGEDFGSTTQILALREPESVNGHASSRKSPGRRALAWTEWHPEANVVASCRDSTMTLHDLNDTEPATLEPADQYDLSQDGAWDEISFLRCAKFLGRDTIACALGGSRRPLRWAKITPTGLDFFDAAENASALEYVASQSEISRGEKTTVRAIETVGHGSSESLLLSAWDDGTYRLLDIRTPSPYDAVYRDRWSTYDAGSSLLVYGTQRFVAGSNLAASIRFYDFRYPKSYHHTDILPCSSELPYPAPPFRRGEALDVGNSPGQCDPHGDASCVWHDRSRQDIWRPDATLYLEDGGSGRVHALAKASDLSDTFYCGLQGTVTEVGLKLAEDVTGRDLKGRSAPPGWRVGAPRGKVALTETGVSLCRENEWMPEEQGVPVLRDQHRHKPHGPASANRSRLDSAYSGLKEA